ncbi:hypothetical protein LJC13_00745 [Peptostreptococcaceae bacterium OttesenSCG-928-C18]|nr:hypothetical protein [Peptostreptococcaceae bacterium OttesenSCG-928-C18]
MNTDYSVIAVLTADTTRFTQGFKEAEKVLESFKMNTKSVAYFHLEREVGYT